MSILEEGLFTYLSTHTGVSALVDERIYPYKLPQNPTFPAIKYRQLSNTDFRSHGGSSGLNRKRMELFCYAAEYLAAKQLADALRLALNNFSGSMGTVQTPAVFRQNTDDEYDEEEKVYFVIVDYFIYHVEAVS